MLAIDFTASNKQPKDPHSLHYMDPNGWNQYQKAIIAVGEILDKYNTDKMFATYGFGGKLPSGQVSHAFALNGNAQNPRVRGVNGILEAYSHALTNVELYGPTNFKDVISTSEAAAKGIRPPGSKYYVLLIITDGEITDMDQTIDAIIDASGMPLSIIIVGVGQADFASMHRLDSDDHLLTSPMTGKKAQRDIVQFVAFRDLHGDGSALARVNPDSIAFNPQPQPSPHLRNSKPCLPQILRSCTSTSDQGPTFLSLILNQDKVTPKANLSSDFDICNQ